MNKSKDNFFIGRLKSIKYAAKGGWLLLTTEHSIIVQTIIAIIMTLVGFMFNISTTEWLFQIIAIALVITAESANTAIEYLCDFIHPEYNKKIGFIKDISAGIPFIAAIFAVIIGLIIYIPKFM
ncbi:diacylglycerol kinase family protein [Urechidicola croceus]|uniref:Diacylglycerol kinase n=1 Tax=Urechidicola croceus TaxID=1850246 RepID=A0A1D8P5T6_9FLAO|nr:diacylglycerol kinase family protein [Urechidicola croceus]AOW19948.1 diacylglycerol kinase [Urechidicola croceus]